VYAPKDVVFISTMNLDGETNLKERTLAFDNINERSLKNFNGRIECDMPNEDLDAWNGNIYSD
jgi:magnesium-transporting ATPase (P-type)